MSKKHLAILISAAAIICLFSLVPSVWQNVYWTHVLILTMINMILAVAFRTFMRTGMLSLGTAGFMLLGAYSSGLLTKTLGFSFWAALPLGGLTAAAVALIVGVPFLRAKGLFFAILTFLMSEGFRLVAWYWTSVTGGSTGLMGIPDPNPINFFGLFTLNFDTRFSYFYLALVIAVLCILILYLIERSWYGLTWSGLRESENLAQAVGINIMGHKLMMFAITSFFMGIAGVLYAHYMGALSPYGTPGSVFSMTNSLYVLIYVIFGGETSFVGPIVGTFILSIFPELVRGLKEYMPMIFGGLLIISVFLMPNGLVGLCSQIYRWCVNRVRALVGGGDGGRPTTVEGGP